MREKLAGYGQNWVGGNLTVIIPLNFLEVFFELLEVG